jgi:hypothetical protein
MSTPAQPLHGIRQASDSVWEVWSFVLQFTVSCGSAADARRIVAALEETYPREAPVDYSAIDAAIAAEPPANFSAKVKLH